MPTDSYERIPVTLATTMGTDEWDLQLPVSVPVQGLIARLIAEPGLGFREQDDTGAPIPYQLMWHEGGRYLAESETLRSAGVQPNHRLIMTQQARAGRSGTAGTGSR